MYFLSSAPHMLFILFIFVFLLLGNFTDGKNEMTDDLIWNEIKAKGRFHPSGRFNSLTWVDDQHQLWLYGGKIIMRTNGKEFKKDLHELWKFNPMSYKWTRIANENQNSSKLPSPFDKGFSCFCHGLAFVFGHHKKRPILELWVYNISSNFWNLIQVPRHVQDCFALWCNEDSESLSLLCHGNITVIKLWIFKIKSGSWKPQVIINNIQFIHTSAKNISMSNRFSVWNDHEGLVFIYIWPYSNTNTGKNSLLLSIDHGSIKVSHVNSTKQEYLSNRRGFIRWLDNHANLHLLGGKTFNFTADGSATHWMLHKSDYSWVRVHSMNFKPSPRTEACFWQAGGNLWLFGGYMRHVDGHVVVLNDFWIGNTSKPVVAQPTPIDHALPGDTLGLTLIHKLIISVVILFAVMAVSIRLCYKRELNQLISRLRKNRVLYHQLSQEGDKSMRL